MLALEKEMLFVFPCWVNFFFLFLFIKRISRILNNEIKKFCANITAKWNWNDLISSKITNIKAIFYARLHLNFLEHNPSKLQQIYQYTSLEFIYAYALNICFSSYEDKYLSLKLWNDFFQNWGFSFSLPNENRFSIGHQYPLTFAWGLRSSVYLYTIYLPDAFDDVAFNEIWIKMISYLFIELSS